MHLEEDTRNQTSVSWTASAAVGTEGKKTIWPGRRHKESRLRKKAEEHADHLMKNKAKNGSLSNISTDPKGATFLSLKKHKSVPVRRKRFSLSSKVQLLASQNKLEEKTEWKALEKLIKTKINGKPNYSLLNSSEMV